MGDSRKKAAPMIQRLVAQAEAGGATVHVYSAAPLPGRTVRRLLFAVDGFPRVPIDQVWDKLHAAADRAAKPLV